MTIAGAAPCGVYIIAAAGRVVTPVDLTSWVTSPAAAAGSHHATTERDWEQSASTEIVGHCVVASTQCERGRALRRDHSAGRDAGPAPAGFGGHAIKLTVSVRAHEFYRIGTRHRRQPWSGQCWSCLLSWSRPPTPATSDPTDTTTSPDSSIRTYHTRS